MHTLPPFRNQALFDQAFTHRSYLNEARGVMPSNERLEFLGDSILSFIVSDYLFREYPEYKEGILTNLRSLLVNTKSLGELARELGFGQLLKLSKGEHEAHGRENLSLLADSYEAFVGALLLDQGWEAVKEFVEGTLIVKVPDIVAQKQFKDPKSMLQEYIQAKKMGAPTYRVLKEEGPAHARSFTVGVFVGEKEWGRGVGKSKQTAEEIAANQALIALEKHA
jgi:ribonuclease-3